MKTRKLLQDAHIGSFGGSSRFGGGGPGSPRGTTLIFSMQALQLGQRNLCESGSSKNLPSLKSVSPSVFFIKSMVICPIPAVSQDPLPPATMKQRNSAFQFSQMDTISFQFFCIFFSNLCLIIQTCIKDQSQTQ